MINIFGIGNILMGDDGFGSLFAQRFKEEIEAGFPQRVRVVDVGTHTIPVLDLLKDCSFLIFVDALALEQDHEIIQGIEDTGKGFFILNKELLTDYGKNKVIMSSHSGGIQEILHAAELIGYLPPKILLLGVKPEDMSTRVGLSPQLESVMPKIKDFVTGLLKKEFFS